jgi:biotin transport system permease protein
LIFLLLWTGLKFGLDLLDAPALLAARQASLLGLRLAVLLLLGLCLSLAGSSRQYGLALTWALRPALGARAWKAGLALALLLHYLALCAETYGAVCATVRLRRPSGPAWRRALLTLQALLRVLGQKTWEQAVALAARRLDSPEAWTARFAPRPRVWFASFGLLLLAGVLAWL